MNSISNIPNVVKQAAKNNKFAQHQLYKCFYKRMLGLCTRMLGNNYVAEDILQDGFIKAFSRLKQLKQPEKFGAWLKQIMVNECVNYLKKIEHYEVVEELTLSNDDNNNNDDWFKAISFEVINSEIDRLPKGCKQIFTLYIIEEYKHKEIAELLGISVSTAKSQYQYALRILKEKLKDKLE